MNDYQTLYNDYVYFTVNIKAQCNTKGELKKICRFPKDWTNLEKSQSNHKHNGLAIITGEKSGVYVIDYDEETNFKRDAKEYPELMNHYVKTNKGYHCYFKWTADLQRTLGSTSVKEHNIDFQGDKKCVFAPPTQYKDEEENVYMYELQANEPLEVMSDDLMEYLKMNYIKKKNKKKKPTKEQEEAQPNKNISDILNAHFGVSYTWSVEPQDGGSSYKISHDGTLCVSNTNEHHHEKSHSVLFINRKVANVSCFSHGTRAIHSTKNKKLLQRLREELGLKTKRDKHKENTNKAYDHVELTQEDIEFIEGKMTTTQEDVACVFYRFFNYKYVCAGETPRPLWYEYKSGLWMEVCGISSLRKDFTIGLYNIYMSYRKYCVDTAEEGNEEEEEHLISCASICDEIILKLKATGFTDALSKQCIHHFIQPRFIEELDKYRHLLCFGEDVYDLTRNEWRKTTKEDLCSKKCGLTKDEISNDYINDLLEVLEDIHPDLERRQFFINSLTDLLYGKNTKELFHIWTGTGRNGKGVVSDILQYAFGDYYASPSVSLITQKRASSVSANPELADTRGCRIVMFSEPEENSRLNNSIIKQYTGGDELTVRKLFSNPFTFTPSFTPIIQCNTFQLQDVKDDSIPARLLFMKFKTSFVDDPTMDWQRQKNPQLKNEESMKRLKSAMMWLLLETWKVLSPEHTFDTPQSIMDDKQEFLDENDNIKQFVDECLIFTKERTDFIPVKQLLGAYRDFMEEREERTGKLTMSGFRNRIKKYMGEFLERYRPYSDDGSRTEHRSVFLYCVFRKD